MISWMLNLNLILWKNFAEITFKSFPISCNLNHFARLFNGHDNYTAA